MSKVSIVIRGLRKLRRDMRSAEQRFTAQMDHQLKLAAETVVGEAQRSGFQGERTRARMKGRPVTSPPNKLGIFEGTYRRAIGYDLMGPANNRVAEVGPATIKYARRHEYGTKGMPKRPVMGPAVDATQDQVFKLLGRTFKVL